MSGGYGIAGHKNSYTRARIENWAEDWRGQELMERRGTTFTRFDAKTEATSRFSHPAREPARDLGPQPAPRTDADPRAGQAPHILLAHGKFAHDPKADDPARFASMSHTMHAAAVAATPLTSTDVIAEPDRRKPGVEAALIAGNRLGLTASREKSVSTSCYQECGAYVTPCWVKGAGSRFSERNGTMIHKNGSKPKLRSANNPKVR
jgi:hypothetical protein